ncbi:transmembrane protein 64 [Anopheles cruzii]|uniref:transmembrane protein 64 n=1 Tax=Anopheles cruzii TaxID=68878 RepID=UPI0022EC8C97|nr:transmembrane protein 64 [Anopheles cruzii]
MNRPAQLRFNNRHGNGLEEVQSDQKTKDFPNFTSSSLTASRVPGVISAAAVSTETASLSSPEASSSCEAISLKTSVPESAPTSPPNRPGVPLHKIANHTLVEGMSPVSASHTILFDLDFANTESPHYTLVATEPPAKSILARPSSLVAKETTGHSLVSEKAITSIAMREHLLYRWQRIAKLHRKSVFNYLLPLCVLVGLLILIYSFRETAKGVLYWIETQNSWVIFVIFLCMFTIVSFPVTVGYLVLIIASGYLFGFGLRGLLTVVIGANLGVAVAHNTIKALQSKLPLHKLIKNETGRAILRVISGPRAFKIVLFARLTPIPFGLQNTIFGISSVNTRSYHAGTIIGLLPAQTINVYLGSKLRSIHEVLNDHNAALGLAGYGVFVVEVIVGAALMVWVIQKARMELSAALLATEADSDEKILIEIEA